MDIQTHAHADTSQLTLTGRFDFNHTGDVYRAVRAAVASQARQVTVDLSGVDYIDSSALGVLILLRRELPAHIGFELQRPQDMVRRALELVNIHRLLIIRP